MTDVERKRIEAICKTANISDIGELSDGFHTFNDLYYQRMILFATIVKQNKELSWKSLRHEDGELCFGGGWFIVGVDTLRGSYTYHYEDKFFQMFECEELNRAKHWDGHTDKDVVRLLSLPSVQSNKKVGHWSLSKKYKDSKYLKNGNCYYICSECGSPDIHLRTAEVPYCWHCGARMMGKQE